MTPLKGFLQRNVQRNSVLRGSEVNGIGFSIV